MMPISEKTLQQNRYRLMQKFGRDDEGATYQAFDNVLKTNVVLKEISINFVSGKTSTQAKDQNTAFADEAKILSSIQHESLPHVHDYFSETDRHYLVMEMIDGKSLADTARERKAPFAFAESVEWASQILDALGYLHKNLPPVIHCAVNPRNIKLTQGGTIKLLDVGQTHPQSKPEGQSSEQADLPYLPLEQIWGGLDSASRNVIVNSYDERSERILEQPPDARSDLYAVGATLYFLITGQTPADALTRSIDLLEGKNDPLESPSTLNPEVPAKVSEVILRAMEIKRENRFDSAVLMRRILCSALEQAKQFETRETEANQMKIAEASAQAEAAKSAERDKLEQERKAFEQKRREIEAEKQRLEEDRRLVEQKKLEIEAERQKQSEIHARQLREAEAQKRLAEQRAAEAEKLLRETKNDAFADRDEIFELDDIEVLDIIEESSASNKKSNTEKSVPTIFAKEILPVEKIEPVIEDVSIVEEASETSKNNVVAETSFKNIQLETSEKNTAAEASVNDVPELGGIFAETSKESGSSFKMIAIAAVLLLVIGGVGAWFIVGSKNQTANQPGAEAKVSSNTATQSAPTMPEQTPAMTQTTSETNSANGAANTSVSENAETAVTDSANPQRKDSPALNAPQRLKKTAAPQPATAPRTKKSVTVDDIINDN